MTPEERFWAKVDKSNPDSCWEWLGCRNPKGYGMIRTKTGTTGAHRRAYELSGGVLVRGLVIDHLCRNRGCVNPAHMEQVSAGENTRRGIHASSKVTHCPAGHPYDAVNTAVICGKRHCRICRRENQRARRPGAQAGWVPCAHCGVVFYRAWAKRRFCSRRCAGRSQRGYAPKPTESSKALTSEQLTLIKAWCDRRKASA